VSRHYAEADLELIYRTAKTSENVATLASLLGRTPGAIEWVMRTIDEEAGIGPRGSDYLGAQALLARAKLGRKARGQLHLSLDPARARRTRSGSDLWLEAM
jgi:hypothetical protein